MSILGTIENCITQIPTELVVDGVFYVELPRTAFETVRMECETKDVLMEGCPKPSTITKVKDIGKGFWMNFMGRNIAFILNDKAPEADNFYIAFKTKII